MKTALVFLAITTVALSGPVPEKTNGSVETLASTPKVGESTITYWFFSKENPTNGVPITRNSLSNLDDTSFSIDRDTIFIIHGWQNTNTSGFVTTVRKAVVTNLNVNVFVVDWSEIAAQDYIPARRSVSEVGGYVADFIQSLVTASYISLSRTSLVGHSLGAHVAGLAGGALNGAISVIVGLDPALPLFATSGVDERLDPSDAQFVQVIHTNGGLKGFVSPIGDSDFYPNGGLRQPGCGSDINGSCAHARAYVYYAESLGGGRFVGFSCRSYAEYSSGACSSSGSSLLGTSQIDTRASGRYYLDTNSESPFARG